MKNKSSESRRKDNDSKEEIKKELKQQNGALTLSGRSCKYVICKMVHPSKWITSIRLYSNDSESFNTIFNRMLSRSVFDPWKAYLKSADTLKYGHEHSHTHSDSPFVDGNNDVDSNNNRNNSNK